MKKKKLLTAVMSLALVGVVAVGGTLAYLSDKSNEVKNTITVGQGYVPENPDDPNSTALYLDEKDVNNPTGKRTRTGNNYKDMLPGDSVVKDPMFHLTSGSPDSYVFAYVTGLNDIKAKHFEISGDVQVQPSNSSLNADWTKVDGTQGLDGLYVYGTPDNPKILEDGAATTALFNKVWYRSDVSSDTNDDNYEAQTEAADKVLSTITIKGVAVQQKNAKYADALAAAKAALNLN